MPFTEPINYSFGQNNNYSFIEYAQKHVLRWAGNLAMKKIFTGHFVICFR